MQTSFSDADRDQILELVPQMDQKLKPSERQRLSILEERNGIGSDKYLEEVMRLYKIHMLGVFEKVDTYKGKGAGKKKEGAHSTDKHH